ncbi:signal peptidase I [Candidatus Kaiserbacteria bacterium]|nr:signal peptidase I [Candidatus Kaiserbacteria bacterium]
MQNNSPDIFKNNDQIEPEKPAVKQLHPILEIIQFAVIALIIVVPIRMFIAQPFIVSGASMVDTFHTGEYLIVDQISYRFHKPERGDIIIFRYPRDPSKFFIKRVIATPGDTIDINGNVVTIFNDEYPDGKVLDETYVESMKPDTNLNEKLGSREYFVMGDNRDQSSDSRIWGVLQEENIIGRAFVRLFPISKLGAFPGEHRYKDEPQAEDVISE